MPNWFTRKAKCKSKSESNPKPVKKKDKANSFDEALARTVTDLSSPVNACKVNAGSGRGSGFAFGLHPLPRPVSSPLPAIPHELVAGSGSGSSVSSSGSDETPDLAYYRYGEPINMPRGRSPVPDSQRHPKSCDISVSPKREFNLYCGETSSHHQTTKTTTMTSENIFCNRGHPLPTSPIHPRAIGVCPGSPRLRQDDLKSPPHPLPLPPPSSPRSSSSRSIPSQWRKGKLLGRGTFGHVYLGFNRESGQMCAIKEVEVISDDNNSKECLRQLNQEIALLSKLSHPNIVQYYGSELADDTLSVYLEYVSGGSVNKLLNDYGPFGEPVIRSYTRQILSGLAYLHGRNTMHRDIKGANILVDPNGEIKLADFGMAKHISGFNSVRSFKGSPYWMAPEVIMNGSGYNLAVDIWSLGCTILEMATSKPPWSVFEGVQAIFKIANSRELPDIPEHLSSDAKKFLMLCLQRDPAARPTATQLMDHPFVRDQATKSSVFRDMLSPLTDTTHRIATMDLSSNRSISPLPDREYGVRFPTATRNQSDGLNMRMNMSLPVSPCSSPLRQLKQHNRSCLPSPPHPSYSTGTINYGQGNYFPYNTRPSYNFDPFPDIPQLKSPTPYGSPRR